MYAAILKKDLKRKKTMNIILLIFITLAVTFIASSVSNVISVTTALDSFFAKAGVPDYWLCTSGEEEADRLEGFIESKNLKMFRQDLLQIEPKNVLINGKEFDYSNTVTLSDIKHTVNLFDKNNKKITKVNDGEIYVTAEIYSRFDLHEGDNIEIKVNGATKKFTLMGSTKDALFASPIMGMTRLLISTSDYKAMTGHDDVVIQSIGVFTDDVEKFTEDLFEGDFNTIFSNPQSTIKTTYIMDMVNAAVVLIVSICLILISLVILRFTIQFTMSEEFREIGVMKAIGIASRKIRSLYLVKYLAISIVGGGAGLVASIPFGRMLIENVSQNIIIPETENYLINIFCAVLVIGIVFLFGYLCTRRINKVTPMDALRSGERGIRYKRKGLLRLSRTRLTAVPFMALNDILSSFRRFGIMMVIFTLGVLLVIVPVNTINTLQSDKLVSLFSMASADHVLNRELMLNNDNKHKTEVENKLRDVKEMLEEKGMKADVFMEMMFRMNISLGEKKCSSLAFQGVGDVTADQYTYLEGSAPENKHEVGISRVIADKIGADIGDTVEINVGNEARKYTVTALFQTMNNMGEGIRFYQNEDLDYQYAAGSFATQIKYTDEPDNKELEQRKETLKTLFPEYKIYTLGEYLSYMMGDVAGQIQGTKQLILGVVICINLLVTVLMVKSFITKEKGQIGMMKAIGFRDTKLMLWQTMRIGIVMVVSVLIGTVLSAPISKLTAGQVFKIMGASTVEFDIVPLEVYVIYPLVILSTTILAAFLTARQLKKISASETSNIE